jgi:hypothetical protein
LLTPGDDATVTEVMIAKLEQLGERMLAEVVIIVHREDVKQGVEIKDFLDVESLASLEGQFKAYKVQIRNKGGRFNCADTEARFMPHPGHGKHTSYNAQLSVSGAGIIIEADVTNEVSDNHLLKERVSGIEENTGIKVEKLSADSGFFETNKIKELMSAGREVVVPKGSDVKRARGKNKKYDIKDFQYDGERDIYICPAGKKLDLRGVRESHGKNYRVYEANGLSCQGCANKESCYRGTSERWGRQIYVLSDREFLECYEVVMAKNHELVKKGKTIVEGVIGVLKFCFKFAGFLLRGVRDSEGGMASDVNGL